MKNKKLKIALDCDDVLYECNSLAINKLNSELGSAFKLSQIDRWGMQNNDLDKRLKYFSDPDFVRNQRPIKGAEQFVKELCERAEIFICTSVPLECVGARLESIRRYFPWIKRENIFIGNRKDLITVDIMLDDNPDNLLNDNVRYPVLFQQPWNYEATGYISVSNYISFLQLVDKLSFEKPSDNYEVIILVGPTGAGKKDFCEYLCRTNPGYFRFKTCSTAKKKHHVYIEKAVFESLMMSDFFDEVSAYNGNLYGVRYTDIDKILENGKTPVLVMDINGALTLSSKYKTKTIYVNAPKSKCIENILRRNLSNKEKTTLILAIDAELKNKNLCDEIVNI